MSGITLLKKPLWLNKRIDFRKSEKLSALLSNLKLNTICQEAKCPNISECFNEGVASFLILGDTCTRECKFCAVNKGIPKDIDPDEPKRIKEAVEILNLKHVVITSVTRDDLVDGGAIAFCNTINELKKINKLIIEVLVPDFKENKKSIEAIINRKPNVFAHNLEIVPSLYKKVRKKASYNLSLNILKYAKELDENIYTKSGIMLGLGETEEEVMNLFKDLRKVKCDFLSIGQYLAPSLGHFKIKEFIRPEKFDFYKKETKKLGFLHVESAPYVRSSYLASKYFE